MLKAQKKISKRELKKDALLTSVAKVTSFYEENKKNAGIVVGVVALLVVGSLIYTKNRAENNEKANAEFGKVYSFYDNGQYQIAIDGVTERGIVGLKSIVENYGGTDAGNLARFYLASAYYQSGRYDEALKQFEDFSASEQMMTVSRLTGIACSYEAKGEYEKAAEHFEKAALSYPKDVDAAANLNHAADNYALAGKKERALDLYKKLKKDYPTTQYARDADRNIARLSA
jgi:tetratricopeptide (TPR) repeat protein